MPDVCCICGVNLERCARSTVTGEPMCPQDEWDRCSARGDKRGMAARLKAESNRIKEHRANKEAA